MTSRRQFIGQASAGTCALFALGAVSTSLVSCKAAAVFMTAEKGATEINVPLSAFDKKQHQLVVVKGGQKNGGWQLFCNSNKVYAHRRQAGTERG